MLSEGTISFLIAEGKKLAYKRTDGKNDIIVCFNLENSSQIFNLQEKGNFTDLLTDKKVDAEKVSIGPLGAMILKKTQ